MSFLIISLMFFLASYILSNVLVRFYLSLATKLELLSSHNELNVPNKIVPTSGGLAFACFFYHIDFIKLPRIRGASRLITCFFRCCGNYFSWISGRFKKLISSYQDHISNTLCTVNIYLLELYDILLL